MLEMQQLFTSRLNRLMQEKNISQTDLAEAVGCTRQTVGFYLSGKRYPDIVNAGLMARALGVSCDYLIGLSDFREDRIAGITARQLGLTGESVRFIGGLRLLSDGEGEQERQKLSDAFGLDADRDVLPCQIRQAKASLRLLNALIAHDGFGVLLQKIRQYADFTADQDVCAHLEHFALQLASSPTGKKYNSSDPLDVAKSGYLKAACEQFEEIVRDISKTMTTV